MADESAFSLSDLVGMPEPEAWRVPRPPATTLLVFLPPARETGPEREEFLDAIQATTRRRVTLKDTPRTDAPEITWTALVEVEATRTPVLFWCERAAPTAPGSLGNAEAEGSRWTVGIQTLLDPTDAPGTFAWLMRTAARAMPDAPAVLDVYTQRLFDRSELDRLFVASDLEPPAELLWAVHVSGARGSADARHEAEDPLWLFTHGLARCGKPELELLGLPARHARAGIRLLNAVGESLLEEYLPPPGEPFEPGPGLPLCAQPWEDVAATLPEDAPGRPRERAADPEMNLLGTRAVLCDPEPRGAYRKLWVWPERAIERLESGFAAFHRAERAAGRRAARAREAWPRLADLWRDHRDALAPRGEDARAEAVVQMRVDEDDEGEGTARSEHLWFKVDDPAAADPVGTLVHDPAVLRRVESGDVRTIDPTRVSDFAVHFDGRTYEPTTIEALAGALCRSRSGGA